MDRKKQTEDKKQDELESTDWGSSAPEKGLYSGSDPVELLKNGDILFSEGFVDEAKRAYWAVLRIDARNVHAKTALKKIESLELSNLFGGRSGSDSIQKLETDADHEKSLRRLEAFLDLDEVGKVQEEPAELVQQIVEKTKSLDFRERVDLVVAMIQLEFYECAQGVLAPYLKDLAASGLTPEEELSVVLLSTEIATQQEKYFDSIALLEPIALKPRYQDCDQKEVLYQLGKCFDSLKQKDRALFWFQRVFELDPFYRNSSRYLSTLIKEKGIEKK